MALRALVLAAMLATGASTAWSQVGFDYWGRCNNGKLADDKRIGYCSRLLYNGGGPNSEIAVLTILGGIYRDEHQYAKAIELFSRAVKYEELGVSRYDHALPSPDALIAAFEARSETYALNGQHDLALADTAEIFKLAPDRAASYAVRCRIRAVMKAELADALADCDQAAKREPRSVEVLDAAGLVQFRLGHLKEAAADYDEALHLGGKLPGALFMRGIIEQRNGNAAAGTADVAEAKEQEPSIAGRFADLGIVP